MEGSKKFLGSENKRNNWRQLITWISISLPACVLGFLILKYGVNVPIWDQWDTPGYTFYSLDQGESLLPNLTKQHNEHRLFFSHLFFVIFAYLTDWDTRYEIFWTFLIACLTSFNVFRLCQLTLDRISIPLPIVVAILNLLIFSPVQYENWLWGFQSSLFFPMFYITCCLLVCLSKLSSKLKLVVLIGISTVSTFSLSIGLFCWIASFLGFIFSPSWKSLQWKRRFVCIFSASFLFNLFLYFRNYNRPAHSPSLTEALTSLEQSSRFFFSFLGFPISTFDTTNAVFVGFVLFLLFFLLTVYFLIRIFKTPALLYRAAPWFIIGLYPLAAAAMITLARSGYGFEQAFNSRYTTFSIYLIVAIIPLLTIAVTDLREQFQRSSQNSAASSTSLGILTQVLPVIITAVMVLNFLSMHSGFRQMHTVWRTRLAAQVCLRYVSFVDDRCIVETLYPNADYLRERATAIDSIDSLNIDLAKEPFLKRGKGQADRQRIDYGFFDALIQSSPDTYIAKGWAALPDAARSADAVVLTYRKDQDKPTVFAVAPVQNPRPDIAEFFHNNIYTTSGWETSFSVADLPSGDLRIDAWAYDIDSEKAYKTKHNHWLNHPTAESSKA